MRVIHLSPTEYDGLIHCDFDGEAMSMGEENGWREREKGRRRKEVEWRERRKETLKKKLKKKKREMIGVLWKGSIF